jgi:hypothetical protein
MRFIAIATVLLGAGLAGAQPANDECANATPIGALPFSDAVDTTDATSEAGDPTFDCDTNSYGQEARSVWYSYTSASGGPIVVDTFGSDYDTVLTVWRGTCGSLLPLASCNDDDWDASSSSQQSRLVVTLAAGETVYVEVASKDAPGGNLAFQAAASSAFQVVDESSSYRTQGPDAAAAVDGTFVVVWQDRDNYQVMGRRFCDTGAPLGPTFAISGSGSDADEVRIVRSGDDGFVVVWVEEFSSIQARRLNASGVPSGAQFEVAEDYPVYFDFGVAGDPTGHFVVAWDSFGADGDDVGIVARRFDSTNALVGGQFLVNTYTTGQQFHASVASDAAGNFVITWESDPDQDGSGSAIIGRRYDAAGAALGGEFQVNVGTTYDQTHPAITARDSGEFVIMWQTEHYSCTNCVLGRRFDAAGAPQGGDFVVSDGTSAPPSYYVSIDADTSSTGDFTVAWADENDFPWARSFQADATPVASAFNAGFVEDDYQRNTRIAVAADGDFVVVWDWVPQGSNYKIMARTFTQSPSCPALGPCPASPRAGCKQPTIHLKGNLTLKDKTPDDRDGVVWKWVNGEATSPAEIGDALATDSYSFCLYDGNDALLAASTVPPGGTCTGGPCWKDLDGLGFKYADGAGTADDVRKMLVKSGIAGKAKVIVKVQGESLEMPVFPPVLPLRAQLASTTGTCWEAEFRAEGVTKSTPAVFGVKPTVE